MKENLQFKKDDLSEDSSKRKTDEDLNIILERYGIIRDVIAEIVTKGDISSWIKTITNKEHFDPFTKKSFKISRSTIYRYIKAYKENGIDGLQKKIRSDKGSVKAIPSEVLEFAIKLKKEVPTRSAETIIDILESKFANVKISKSTLNYHLKNLGYSKHQLKNYATKSFGRFESKLPNDLWLGDYHDKHGLLKNGKEVHLSAFIDCKTRYVVYGEYYLGENLLTLENSFKKATLKNGCPKKVFVDNAKIYHSKRFEYCCLKLGIQAPIFSTAYVSESRGKIERLFGYIKSAFEEEVIARGGCDSIEELNLLFEAFLELRYNRRVHSETKCIPAEEYQKFQNNNYPDINILNELFMMVDKRTVHKKTKTVSILAKQFLTDTWLGGKKVEVHYNPVDLSYVLIYFNKKFIMKTLPFELNSKVKPAGNIKDVDDNFKFDYLQALKGKYDTLLKENASLTKYSNIKLKTEIEMNFCNFLEIFSEILNRNISNQDEILLNNFFDRFRPETLEIVQQSLFYAKSKYGNNQHISFYLDIVKLFILSKRGGSK